MRIAIIVEHLHARGGTQRQALELAKHLMDAGNDVMVFSTRFNRFKCFPEINKHLNIITVSEKESLTDVFVHRNSVFLALRKVAVYLLNIIGFNYILKYKTMVKATDNLISIVYKYHKQKNFNLINPHDYGPASWAANVFAKRVDVPVVWQCNDPLLRWVDTRNPLILLMMRWLIDRDRKHVSSIHQITVLDNKISRIVGKNFSTLPVVVRSGVDFEKFKNLPDKRKARMRLGLPQNKPIILVLALLNSRHRRVEDTVAAHARISNDVILLLSATVHGDRDYASVIKKAVNKSPMRDRIIWNKYPLKNEEELLNLYAASDIFVFPNIQQTWGLAVIEAAAAGLPIVISDGAGAHEVFTHGQNVFRYHGGNIKDLYDKLDPLVVDVNLRKRIGKAARDFVRQQFSWNQYTQDMMCVFNDVITSHGRQVSQYKTIADASS